MTLAKGRWLASASEFFLLRTAERTARAYTSLQRDRVNAHHLAAEQRQRAAGRLVDPVCAAILLREALVGYLRAAAIVRTPAILEEPMAVEALAEQLSEVPSDPVASDGGKDTERVRLAIRSSSPLFFDRLERGELERTRWALDRAASALRRAGEVRSIAYVRGARFGRIAAVVAALAFVVFRIVDTTFWPDLAHGKPVMASSVLPGSPDGHDLVEGGIGTSFAIATNVQDAPWIQVDLLAVYKINTVKVYNRVDGWFDDCLPLVLQTSVDGAVWDDVGRRDTTFIYNPPWIVRLDHKPARFIRVHAIRKTYLALSAVSVFGSK
jgi:F5/8 type C domain